MNKKIYSQEVTNLHTHSFYCGHGTGTIAEYAKEATIEGLQLLGFSEHCPVEDNRWERSRMELSQIPLYEQDCEDVKEQYSGSLDILTGYECDYLRQYDSYYAAVKERVDYMVCAIHDLSEDIKREYSVFWNRLTKEDLATYADMYCAALSSGLFLFGAHPDVFAYNYFAWDSEAEAVSRAIIECAVDNDVALEINANGMRKRLVGSRYPYPLTEFWKIASEYPLKVVTNSDAHAPFEVRSGREECFSLAEQTNLQFVTYQVDEKSGLVFVSP